MAHANIKNTTRVLQPGVPAGRAQPTSSLSVNGIRPELLPRAIGKLLGDLTRVSDHGQLWGACVGGQLHQLIDAQAGRQWRQLLRFLSASISEETGQVRY